jgi:O-succinylbenzoic acid--CoA ligase
MNTNSFRDIHKDFRLNGLAFDAKSLLQKANDLIEKGLYYEQQIGLFLSQWLNDSDFIDTQTSGSTGLPKTISISKKAMVESAIATGLFFDLKPGNSALNCLSSQYIAGKMMLVRALVLGLELDCVEPSSTPLESLKKYDFAAMVPMQVQNSIDKLDLIKTLIIGGAKMNPHLQIELTNKKGSIYETFGMTETISHFAAKKIGEESFTVLPNITIFTDQRDCLVINAPRISNQNIATNDLVSVINETQFVYLGRIDSVVNSGGVKLFPEQIETKLASNIKARFFIIGIPDALLGDKLILVIEGNKIVLQDSVFGELNVFEKPKETYFVPQFIETETGKINRIETMKALIY